MYYIVDFLFAMLNSADRNETVIDFAAIWVGATGFPVLWDSEHARAKSPDGPGGPDRGQCGRTSNAATDAPAAAVGLVFGPGTAHGLRCCPG